MLLKLLMEAFQGAMSSDSSDGSRTSLMDAIRALQSASNTLGAQANLYVQLAQLEWEQEKQRLIKMCIALIIALFAFWGVMLFSGVLVLALVWDTQYRVLTIGGLIAIYFVVTILAAWRLKVLAARGTRAFASIREELAADIELIKSEL